MPGQKRRTTEQVLTQRLGVARQRHAEAVERVAAKEEQAARLRESLLPMLNGVQSRLKCASLDRPASPFWVVVATNIIASRQQ